MSIEPFDVVDQIRTKRDKGALTTEQIGWMIDAYTRGYVADEQMSAMTMAIFKTCSWNIGTPRVRSSVGCSCASM